MIHILFIPGLYGSALLNKDSGHREFPSIKKVLLQSTNVALHVPGVSEPKAKDLAVGPVLDKVPVVGSFYSIDAYEIAVRNIRTFCRDIDCRITEVPFDWRKEPLEGINAIQKTINELKTSSKDEFYLVAHSYGALISTYFLLYGDQPYENAKINEAGLKQIKGAILATAPFYGATALFRNVIQGALFNRFVPLIKPEIYSTLESPYFMMPPEDRLGVYTPDRRPITVPYYDPAFWKQNKLGLFADNSMRRDDDGKVSSYLKNLLTRVKAFHSRIDEKAGHLTKTSAKIFYLHASGYPTPERGVWDQKPGTDGLAFYEHDVKAKYPNVPADWINVDGDGSVPSDDQEAPPALKAILTKELRIKNTHLESLDSPEFRDVLSDMLKR